MILMQKKAEKIPEKYPENIYSAGYWTRLKRYKTTTGEISVEKQKAWKAHSNQHLTI